jgi:hypothetical protein
MLHPWGINKVGLLRAVSKVVVKDLLIKVINKLLV